MVPNLLHNFQLSPLSEKRTETRKQLEKTLDHLEELKQIISFASFFEKQEKHKSDLSDIRLCSFSQRFIVGTVSQEAVDCAND